MSIESELSAGSQPELDTNICTNQLELEQQHFRQYHQIHTLSKIPLRPTAVVQYKPGIPLNTWELTTPTVQTRPILPTQILKPIHKQTTLVLQTTLSRSKVKVTEEEKDTEVKAVTATEEEEDDGK